MIVSDGRLRGSAGADVERMAAFIAVFLRIVFVTALGSPVYYGHKVDPTIVHRVVEKSCEERAATFNHSFSFPA